MLTQIESAVVGGGVIGLAIGRALAALGREVVVLEAESGLGMHTSSRNSGVIHAGIYYPEEFLKTRLCVEGKKALYAYCVDRRIAHQRIGKLVVATKHDQLDALNAIKEQARKNGVTDLGYLDKNQVSEIEPAIDCVGALLSPSTGIIDSLALLQSLCADIEERGGEVLLNHRVECVRLRNQGVEFRIGDDKYRCREFVNAAGLWATENYLSAGQALDDPPALYLAKGHYFAYSGSSPFNHLVYPIPSDSGLGIHATNDLSGAVRFGPDIKWVDAIDYGFEDVRKPAFVSAIKEFFPSVDESKLTPAFTGVRPRLHGPTLPAADFDIRILRISEGSVLVHLFGIESPGLTASLAIADYVLQKLQS